MNDLFEDKLIGEDENFKFYENSFTKSITDYAENTDNVNPCMNVDLHMWCALTEEKKNGRKEYILIDKFTNEVVYANQKFEDMCVRIEMLKLSQM